MFARLIALAVACLASAEFAIGQTDSTAQSTTELARAARSGSRAEARRALRALAQRGPEGVAALGGLLRDSSTWTQSRASAALAEMGPIAVEALPDFLEALGPARALAVQDLHAALEVVDSGWPQRSSEDEGDDSEGATLNRAVLLERLVTVARSAPARALELGMQALRASAAREDVIYPDVALALVAGLPKGNAPSPPFDEWLASSDRSERCAALLALAVHRTLPAAAHAALVRALQSDSELERRRAVEGAWLSQAPCDVVRDALQAQLESHDSRCRMRAALALDRCCGPTLEATKLFCELARSAEAELRRDAVAALGSASGLPERSVAIRILGVRRLGSPPRSGELAVLAIACLTECLADQDESIVEEALQSLGRFGASAESASGPVRALLDHPSLGESAGDTLELIAGGSDAELEVLRNDALRSAQAIAEPTIAALSHHGAEGAAVLVEVLRRPEPWARVAALDALADLGPLAASAQEAVWSLVGEPRALGSSGLALSSLFGAVSTVVKTSSQMDEASASDPGSAEMRETVRDAALLTLSRIAGGAPNELLELLDQRYANPHSGLPLVSDVLARCALALKDERELALEGLESPRPHRRALAFATLVYSEGFGAEDVRVEVVVRAAREGEPQLRALALEALAAGRPACNAMRAVAEAGLEATEPGVRLQSARLLDKACGSEGQATRALLDCLASADSGVALSAAMTLGENGPRAVDEVLSPLLQAGSSDDFFLRQCARGALANLAKRQPEMLSALQAAAKDSQRTKAERSTARGAIDRMKL
jgi:hypothetical protein